MQQSFEGRTNAIKDFLDREHFRFRRQAGVLPSGHEVALSAAWAVRCDAPPTALTDRMRQDFLRFCHRCMEISLTGTDGPTLVWRLTNEPFPPDFDRQDGAVEAFEIQVYDEQILVSARHERGLLHATHHMEWIMADRGAPFLPRTTISRKPAFSPRLTNGVFIEAHQSITSPGEFSDDYLALMSHYGANGIFLYVDLWSVFKSGTLPELNSERFEEQIAALRRFNERILKHGLDLYLHLNTPPLMEDHAVFKEHPDVQGALVEICFEGLSGRPWHNLCSGSGKVRAAYAEAIENLFGAASEVAGAMMIIGGECFYHCYTRPANVANGQTNCPRCESKPASMEVADLVNLVNRAVKRTGSHKALYAWPYSAVLWSSGDPHQQEWLKHLDADVSVLTNFDCGDDDTLIRSGPKFYDYNIKCIGPSTTFAKQADYLAANGRPIFTKVETNTTPDAFFLPYLPLYYRWLARWSAVKAVGVAGFVGQWRFFGMNASPPEELQYKMTWATPDQVDDILPTICRRDFGLDSSAVATLLDAWRRMSTAWDMFPYSAMTAGERAAYMRGPFYLGPAHPLIFDVQDHYDLPQAFREIRGDMAEIASSEELDELRRKAKPRYVSDLLLTLPFGVERYLELLGQCRRIWSEGMNTLRDLLSSRGERARMELNVCETLDSHLCSLENVVRFYRARDLLQNQAGNLEDFNTRIAGLAAIIDGEISNALKMLPIIESDLRCGYGHTYGPVYDVAMVRAKIAQCQRVRDEELPRFSKLVRFHVWLDSP